MLIDPAPEQMVCDFCSSPEIVRGYNCQDFALAKYSFGSKHGFAACAKCAALIDAGKWMGLENRSVRSFFERNGPIMTYGECRKYIHELHTAFRRYRLPENAA